MRTTCAGRLARAENDLRETLAQRAVRVHLREAEVRHGRGLKGAQDLVAAHAAGAKFFQELDGFRRCHGARMAENGGVVTQEKSVLAATDATASP